MTDEIRLPDTLVPITSDRIATLPITTETLKNWITKYKTKTGKHLGKKIGGRWYVNVAALIEYISDSDE